MNEPGWRGLARIMPPDAKARFGFSFRRKDYIKDTASIGEERLDETKNFTISMSGKVLGDMSGEISFSHTDTESNLESVVSTENAWALTFTYDF